MNVHRSEVCSLRTVPTLVHEPESAWEVRAFVDLVPPATLTEARVRRDELAALLGRERAAAADFLLALADFDRRRGWERLGHASLFAFLTRELALSNGAAWLRLSAARLLPRFPAVEAALRDGRLCLSAVGELSRVIDEQNASEVLPRFFGRSSREAREVAAAILPCPAPPRREVVTRLPVAATGLSPEPAPPGCQAVAAHEPDRVVPAALALAPSPAPGTVVPLRAHEVGPTQPARDARAAVEPLTAELRRLHLTVSTRFLEKVAAARNGLSHAVPGATSEQVLEAALDLLLESQARRKALVKRPRSRSGPAPEPARAPRVRHVPAAIEREVRLRDGDRCQHPLDTGGICGSTWQVELDHLVPLAQGGPTTIANLRCACRVHNRRAAEQALGVAALARRRRRGR